MVEDEASDMSNRSGTGRERGSSRRAWTNHDQIGVPLNGAIDDFSLRASLSAQQLGAGNEAQTLVENILGGQLFRLLHLLSSWAA
jgi:hypothetical protein